MTRGGSGDGAKHRRGTGGRAAVLATALAAALMAPPAITLAAPPAAAASPQEAADLQRIAAYLNSIHTMTARFSQVSSDGQTAGGRLWLERPGRMRFEYDPPSPILLIADRFYVYYIDKDLAEVSQIGLKSTPAWFLLRDPIRFGDQLAVTGFQTDPGFLRLTVIEREHPDLGSLTMTFSRAPLRLRQWTVVDSQGRTTTVSLSQEQFGMALPPDLFQYRNPYTGHSTEP